MCVCVYMYWIEYLHRFLILQCLQHIKHLECLECLQNIQHLECLQCLQRLQHLYLHLEIVFKNTIIYRNQLLHFKQIYNICTYLVQLLRVFDFKHSYHQHFDPSL